MILQCETIDKREVHNKSPNMEREGLDRAVRNLKEQANVAEVTTDASTSVTKMLSKTIPCFYALGYVTDFLRR